MKLDLEHPFKMTGEKMDTLSPWVTLVSRTVESPLYSEPQIFHSFKLGDYVAVLSVTADGRIPLVKQFRPAMQRVTLELPAGLLETGENPADAAERELLEETGFLTRAPISCMGSLDTDTGRLENTLWCYFAEGVEEAKNGSWMGEGITERVVLTKKELLAAVEDGTFRHALHLAILAMAMMKGKFSF